jgi:ribosome-binding protein aMBF1 (putative translation factor)
MLTVADIVTWQKSQGLSCRELAEMLSVNYFHLAAVLRGQRPLTDKLAKQVQDAMESRSRGLHVEILPQYAELLRKWAETAGITEAELVQELLADALKIRGAKKDAL